MHELVIRENRMESMKNIVWVSVFFGAFIAPLFGQYPRYQHLDEQGNVTGYLSEIIDVINPGGERDSAAVHAQLKSFISADRKEPSKEQIYNVLRISRTAYAGFRIQDPPQVNVNEAPVALVFTGSSCAMLKRGVSLTEFDKQGYRCKSICFIANHEKLFAPLNDFYKLWLRQARKNQFWLDSPHFSCMPEGGNLNELFASLIPIIYNKFYVVSDPEHAIEHLKTCREYTAQYGLECVGVFVRPCANTWEEYVQKECIEQKIVPEALAYNTLELLSNQLGREIAAYKKEHKEA